jgi:2,5-diketo-D-gluconate reductase A
MREHGVQAQAWAPFAEGRNALFENAVLAPSPRSTASRWARWCCAGWSSAAIAALAKTVRRERMAENLDVFDFALDASDVAAIASLETGTSSFFSHRDPAIIQWMKDRRLDV